METPDINSRSLTLLDRARIQFSGELSAGEAMHSKSTVTQTLGILRRSVAYESEYEKRTRVWQSKLCQCLETRSHVDASSSFDYNPLLVYGLAYALAVAPEAILVEALP